MGYGLLGRTLSHSYSPQIHKYLGNYSYRLFEKEPVELASFLQAGSFRGLNVTIPYKKTVLPYCAELTSVAAALGSVNTILRKDDGKLIGHNSDYFGFHSMVQHSGLLLSGKKVLVLGTGGAAVTVCAVLKDLQAEIVQISRNGENHYGNLYMHDDAAVIVNATPVGMYPDTDQTPVDLSLFHKLEGVLDLIYNPSETRLLAQARKKGLIAENGLWMLIAQALESARWFTGINLPESLIEEIYKKLSADMKNIILVGMPGCGKTTVGGILAKLMDRPFIDTDEEIEKEAGMQIPEFFSRFGEDAFRKLESKILSDICKKSGCIIATGGGCVTRLDNYDLLHQNSTVFWLTRPLQALSIEGRPLSQGISLQDMYDVRSPMYGAFSDFIVENNTTPEETARKIAAHIHKECTI